MYKENTESASLPIGPEQLSEFRRILQRYRAGKAAIEQRIISSENWWRLRNAEEMRGTDVGKSGFVSRSGWLHNVIVNKHADAMESFPEPLILPREPGDQSEADMLSAVIPCVLEQNRFEEVYSEAMWRKMKSGTAVYKVVWDGSKLNGLGDISVECVNVLNLYWEPGVTDIQKSRYLFRTELWDADLLCERYPEALGDGVRDDTFLSPAFPCEGSADTAGKVTVVEVYYHKSVDGVNTLQYVKFVGDTVLFATENDVALSDGEGRPRIPMALTGLSAHGTYPYVSDTLYPVEGSPCGYGYVDICRNPQTEIDLLKTCFIRNARIGSMPRYFSRGDGTVNEEEFLDLDNPIVHTTGSMDESALRPIAHNKLDGSYITLLQWDVNELRETSGNTEASSGITTGVTAAAAIAALQEASGKISRDSTISSHRAYAEIVGLCIELIREFYHLPRKFRILGKQGALRYVSYSNDGILPRHQGVDFGQDMGMRLPVFDIRVCARKRDAYSRAAQNELAMNLFRMGFFASEHREQALLCLGMMDFDGKDEIVRMLKNAAKSTEAAAESAPEPLNLPEPPGVVRARQRAREAAVPR